MSTLLFAFAICPIIGAAVIELGHWYKNRLIDRAIEARVLEIISSRSSPLR